MTLLFESPKSLRHLVQVHALGPHRIRIIVSLKIETYTVEWYIWQYGWRIVDSWSTCYRDDAAEVLGFYQDQILQEATRFIDGLGNDGPG